MPKLGEPTSPIQSQETYKTHWHRRRSSEQARKGARPLVQSAAVTSSRPRRFFFFFPDTPTPTALGGFLPSFTSSLSSKPRPSLLPANRRPVCHRPKPRPSLHPANHRPAAGARVRTESAPPPSSCPLQLLELLLPHRRRCRRHPDGARGALGRPLPPPLRPSPAPWLRLPALPRSPGRSRWSRRTSTP